MSPVLESCSWRGCSSEGNEIPTKNKWQFFAFLWCSRVSSFLPRNVSIIYALLGSNNGWISKGWLCVLRGEDGLRIFQYDQIHHLFCVSQEFHAIILYCDQRNECLNQTPADGSFFPTFTCFPINAIIFVLNYIWDQNMWKLFWLKLCALPAWKYNLRGL